jgi:hypothetical protein
MSTIDEELIQRVENKLSAISVGDRVMYTGGNSKHARKKGLVVGEYYSSKSGFVFVAFDEDEDKHVTIFRRNLTRVL